MRRKLLSLLSAVLMLLGVLVPALTALADHSSAQGWTLSDVSGPVYANGNTTFTYIIGGAYQNGISHLSIGLCAGWGQDKVESSIPSGARVGQDGSIDGRPHVIKWETQGMAAGTQLTVTYRGLWAPTSQTYYIKAGNHVDTGPVTGPSCSEVTSNFAISKKVSTSTSGPWLDEVTLIGGGTAYYRYIFTNTGTTPLTISQALDDKLGAVPYPTDPVPVGGSVTLGPVSKSFPALAPGSDPEQEINTITVSATHGGNTYGPKTDTAKVINLSPSAEPDFTITKKVSTSESGPWLDEVTLTSGGPVWYRFTFTNTGDVPLTITYANDDILGAVPFSPTTVGVGDTVTAMLTKTFPTLTYDMNEQVEINTVTVTAAWNGSPVDTKQAQATVYNLPAPPPLDLTVTKQVSGTNDPASGQASLTLNGGGTAYYFYTVTNTGGAALTITSAVDDKLGTITFTPSRVEPGQSATGAAQKSFAPLGPGLSETEVNVITVSAQADDQRTVGPKTAQATVINNGPNPQPDFTVTKLVSTTNDPATGAKLAELTGGGTVYYFYTLTNTGNIPLTITNVVDSVISPLSFGVSGLNPGGSVTITVPWSFAPLHWDSPPQQVENVISVTMTDGNGYTETKSDFATVINYPPPPPPGEASFTVTKRVGATNNPAAAGPTLTLNNGGTAYYFYTVTNTGEVNLRITSAVDDKLGPITFTPEIIEPGQTAHGTATKAFPSLAPGGAPVSEVNVITVGAISLPDEEPVGPHSAHATVINNPPPPPPPNPNFTVTKTVSTSSDPATGQASVSIQGGTVHYFYTVTNTGDTAILITGAVDDKLGAISLSSLSLAPGQSATGTATKTFPTLAHGSSVQTEVNIITVTASYGASRQAQATVHNHPAPPPPPPDDPDFTITKRVSATNNPATGQASLTLIGGGTAYFFYTVTNTGTVPFQISSAIDDKLGTVTFSPSVIGPGETATAVLTKSFGAVATVTTEVNVVSVTVQANQQTYGPKLATATVINQPLPPPPPTPSLTVLVCPTFVAGGGTVTAENGSGQTVTLQWNGTAYYAGALTAGEWSVILSSPAWNSPHVQTITIRDDLSVPGNAYQLDLFHPCPPRTGTGSGFVCSPKAQSVLTAIGPDGSEVSVTINPTGKSEWVPFNLGDLLPGLWQVVFKEPGKKDATTSGQVQAGKHTDFGYLHLACTGSPAPWPGYAAGILLFTAGLALQFRLRFKRA